MEIISRSLRMRAVVDELRRQRRRVALVPTMGALHAGHLSLVRLAAERAQDVVVSIFVNPKQFGEGEDLASYPRDLTRDAEMLVREGVEYVFAPDVKEIYPEGFRTHVEVEGLSDMLSGELRPGHFRGVTTVVLKLFNIMRPDVAVFGLKDAQQFVILQRLVKDLALDVEIVAGPTVRESDGLACSSRNALLDEAGRRAAPVVYKSLQEAIRRVHEGERVPARVEEAVRSILAQEPLVSINHVKLVEARGLSDPKRLAGLILVLVSVNVDCGGKGTVMLMDNVRVEVAEES